MSAVTPFNPTNISLFQPNQVAGLALWLDAADSSTITLSGANVTQWNDKSSNAHICISNANYTGTTLPTYNSNAAYKNVNFADNQVLVTSSNWNYVTSWSCFVALNSVSLGARWLISPCCGVGSVMMSMNQGINKIYSSAFPSGTTDITGNHIEYTSAENTNAVSNLLWYRDAVLQASNVRNQGIASGTTKLGIGANGTFKDAMAGTYQLYEVLIFNSYLSTTQRQQIESYLAYKWNLQASLPTTHPYYASPYNAYPPFTNINQITKFAYPVLPNQVAGLSLWLDAADSSTITLSGTNVTVWTNKVTNTTGAATINGTLIYRSRSGPNSLPTIDIGAGGIYMAPLTPLTNSVHTTFVIMNMTTTPTAGTPMISYAQSSGLAMRPLDYAFSTFRNLVWNPSTVVVTTPSFLNTFFMATSYVTTSVIGLLTNGGQTSAITSITTNPATITGFGIGYSYEAPSLLFFGNISEVITYSRALSTSEIQQIEGYLAYKWNLQNSLPSSHPYFKNAFIPNMNQSVPTTITMYQYNPRSVSGIALWLDAADSSSVPVTPGTQNVTAWNDKSGGGYTATPTGGTPTYSGSNISLTNSSYFIGNLNIPSGTLLTTAFCVAVTPATYAFTNRLLSANDGVGADYNSPTGFAYSAFTTGGVGYAYRTLGNFTTASIPINTRFMATTIYFSNGNFIFSFNGNFPNGATTNYATTTNTSNTNTLTKYYIGNINTSGQPWNGLVNEFIIFNRTLAQSEYQQIEGYLAWKWGLQLSLPISHPYKLYPP